MDEVAATRGTVGCHVDELVRHGLEKAEMARLGEGRRLKGEGEGCRVRAEGVGCLVLGAWCLVLGVGCRV